MNFLPQDALPVVAVIRNIKSVNHALVLAELLASAGVRTLEVTFDNTAAPELISAILSEFPTGLSVGAGTVTLPNQVDAARAAGATFIVSPHTDPVVGQRARSLALPWIPGVVTPTEAANAHANHADALKVFPAGVLGPEWVKHLKSVPPHLPIMVTGGITPTNARAFLAAGAACVGIGSSIVKVREGELDEKRTKEALVALVASLE